MQKKILINIAYFFLTIFLFTFLLTLIAYFNLLNPKIISISRQIVPLLTVTIISYNLGKKAEKKGYIEGIKFGSLILLLFTALIIILDKYQLKTLLYDLIFLLASTLGSMIGINRKLNNKNI